jgi:hypothetical protein
VATAGFFQLTWDSNGPVELQESQDPDFAGAEVVYTGADTARVMSGKADGNWYYRARAAAGHGTDWSEPVKVTVRHHPLARALAFFAVGATVFAATLVLILGGSRRYA